MAEPKHPACTHESTGPPQGSGSSERLSVRTLPASQPPTGRRLSTDLQCRVAKNGNRYDTSSHRRRIPKRAHLTAKTIAISAGRRTSIQQGDTWVCKRCTRLLGCPKGWPTQSPQVWPRPRGPVRRAFEMSAHCPASNQHGELP